MDAHEPEELRKWYDQNQHIYVGLADASRRTIENLLVTEKVDFLSVTARTKTSESFIEKAKRKPYQDPKSQITDICGIRIITYIESDIPKISALIKQSFEISENHSLDKSSQLGADRIGYRSVHFVCDLGSKRTQLPEYKIYSGLQFEIQVRTVLQHAWAEIEHDRNYKLSGSLPSDLQRRLYLIAGVLEIADREFSAISAELESYAAEVAEKTKLGQLDIEINATSLIEYLALKFPESRIKAATNEIIDNVISELRRFNINSLQDLDQIIDQKTINEINSSEVEYAHGIIRLAMMLHDLERYLATAWDRKSPRIPKVVKKTLDRKYGGSETSELLKKHGVEVVPWS